MVALASFLGERLGPSATACGLASAAQENVEQENVRVVLEGFARYNADEGGPEWRLGLSQ